jgi:protein-tyrosine phosphatase
VDVVVSLLEAPEVEEFELADEAVACAAAGIEFVAAPVPDRGVPASREAFGEVVARLHEAAGAGRRVGVHCRVGIGRSALLVVSLLVTAGVPSGEAFERVRTARGFPVPDTPEQRAWVERFAEDFAEKVG